MEELKTVARFYDPTLAHLAKARLSDNGIESAVFGEDSAYPSVNSVEAKIELKVNPEDYDQASSILEASDKDK